MTRCTIHTRVESDEQRGYRAGARYSKDIERRRVVRIVKQLRVKNEGQSTIGQASYCLALDDLLAKLKEAR